MRFRQWSLALLMAVSGGGAFGGEPVEGNAGRILVLARAATGAAAWDGIKALHLTEKRQIGDKTGAAEIWVDTQQGRVGVSVTDESGTVRTGFNGKTAWIAEADGSVAAADPVHRPEMIAEAFWRGYGWNRPLPSGTSLSWLKAESRSGRDFDIVQIVPAGGAPLTLWFDRASHLPARIVTPHDGKDQTIHLADWRKFHDVSLPWRIDMDPAKRAEDGGAPIQEIVTDVTRSPAADATHFDPPTAPPVDYSFPAGTVSTETAIKIVNDHIFLTGRIGKTKLRLRLDSASPSVIDQHVVDQLGGAATTDRVTIRLPELSIGGVTFRRQPFEVRDLAPVIADEGVPIDATVGIGFLTHLVAELDYDGRRLVLVKPDQFVAPPDATSLPLRLSPAGATMGARIDGVGAILEIDTASYAGLIMNPAFVYTHGLMAGWRLAPALLSIDDIPVAAKIGHAGSLELGVLGVAQPVVMLPETPVGRADGQIGGALLRRYDVIFDYPHARLLLQETGNTNRADSVDHAGLWLEASTTGLAVAGIVKDGPAAHAGLRIGDKILTIGGEKVAAASLPAIRALLTGIPGSGVTFGIDRDGTDKSLRLVLNDPLASPANSP